MAKFRDKFGKEWALDLDVVAAEQIQTRVEGIRINALIANKAQGLADLFDDPVKFVRVLWVMCESQAPKHGVSPEDFGRGMGGDALEDAADAFLEALADFTPRQQRKVLKALLARGREIQTERLPQVLKEIAELKLPTSSTSATTAPPSSESTPAAAG